MRFLLPAFGDIVAEVKADTFEELVGEYTLIGEVTNEKAFAYGDVKIGMDDALDAWTKPLEKYLQQNQRKFGYTGRGKVIRCFNRTCVQP